MPLTYTLNCDKLHKSCSTPPMVSTSEQETFAAAFKNGWAKIICERSMHNKEYYLCPVCLKNIKGSDL